MAKPRKTFAQLAESTRNRKTRWYAKHQGLTGKQVELRYNAGTLGPQTAARGHAHTPEKPGLAYKTAGQRNDYYKDYRDRKNKAVDLIFKFKEAKWGHRPLWNAARAKKYVSHDPETGKIRGITDLRVIENMVKLAIADQLDWHDIVALDYDYESAFYYH